MTQLSDPINVWAFFKKGGITPYVFFWNKRRITIDKINLVHQSKGREGVMFHFSVMAEGNFYRLGFDSVSLKWFLEAVEDQEFVIL